MISGRPGPQPRGARPSAAGQPGLAVALLSLAMTLLALAMTLLGASGCKGRPSAPDAAPVPAVVTDPLVLSGHDPKAILKHLQGRWQLADDGHGVAAWGVAGATLIRRGEDGEAREGWIESPMPGVLRLRVDGLSTWELGLAVDGDRVALGIGRAGQCGPTGCWLADNGLVRRDPDGQCWWHPHRVGGGSIPRFLPPMSVECSLDEHTFTYHLPRRTRPGTADRRQVRRDGNLLLDHKVVRVHRAPDGPPDVPVEVPDAEPPSTALTPEAGAPRPDPAR